MTCQQDCSQFDLAMELLIDNGFDNVADEVGILMNTAMQTKRSSHLTTFTNEKSQAKICPLFLLSKAKCTLVESLVISKPFT